MGEKQQEGRARKGLEFVETWQGGQGNGRPALRRGAGGLICLFSNSIQGAKVTVEG